jgi:hypothetical protein
MLGFDGNARVSWSKKRADPNGRWLLGHYMSDTPRILQLIALVDKSLSVNGQESNHGVIPWGQNRIMGPNCGGCQEKR